MKKNNLKKMIGEFGESAAVKYLKDSGYEILQRNYKNKIGELDIVCQKDKVIHAVEVKTVIGSKEGELVRAEDHLDVRKIHKVIKTASLYALEEGFGEDQKVSIDGLLVRLFKSKKELPFPKDIEKVTVMHLKGIDVI